jgi:hypothetical protein
VTLPAGGRSRLGSVAGMAAVALALLVAAVYLTRAAALLRYPFDWSPDEGLALDYARRVLVAPGLLYAKSAVPFPCAYTPLLPLLLAPATTTDAPLFWGRLLALAWTTTIAASLYLLVRRVAPLALAVACTALCLSIFDMTFWFMLVRVDGLMVALWIAGAAVLMPASLVPGSEPLTRRRLVLGALLLVLSTLAKPTAVVHAAPLVLGWLAVDRRGALGLAAAVGGAGLAVLLLLEAATSGGFLWVMKLWTVHGFVEGQTRSILAYYAVGTWPVAALAALGFVAAARAGARPWRDGSILLLVSGLLAVPGLGKGGAMRNYLLPLLLATGVACGRFWGAALREKTEAARLVALAVGAAAFALAARSTFPVPGPAEEATAAAFYGHVRQVLAERGGPVLAARPDYVSYLAGHPVEVETTSFPYLAMAAVPGVELVRDRLQEQRYALVVQGPFFPPPAAGIPAALEAGYEAYGGCWMPAFYGRTQYVLHAPRGRPVDLTFPGGVGCGLLPRTPPG